MVQCHVIVRNRLSLSMGSPADRRALTDEQRGVQYLAQEHFDMQLSPARSSTRYSRPDYDINRRNYDKKVNK